MKKRPLYLTALAYFLILSAPLGLKNVLKFYASPRAYEILARSPIPVPIQVAGTYGGLLVTAVCGIAMLRGKNWGRWLYCLYGGAGFLLNCLASSTKRYLLPGFTLFALVACLLFLPAANRYFALRQAAGPPCP